MAVSPRRGSVPLDDATISAVEILNEAIKDVRVPGVNDFMVVTSALQRVIDDRRAGDLAVAGAAFDQLDGGVRAGIAEKAVDRAEDRRRAARSGSPALPPLALPSPPLLSPSRPSPPSTAAAKPPSPAAAKPAAKGAPLISAMTGILQRKG